MHLLSRVHRLTVLLSLFLAAACGSDSTSTALPRSTPDTGPTTVVQCGEAALQPQNECRAADDCPDGTNVGPRACSNCPVEALFRVCQAGECFEYDRSGTIDARFVADVLADGGQSYVTMVIDPVMANGRRLTCASLLSQCDVLNDTDLNVVNVQRANPEPPLQQGLAYIALASAHVGTDRIVLIFVTANRNGEGRILTRGCVDGITVSSGQTAQALVTLGE